jgi:hypothetical protein
MTGLEYVIDVANAGKHTLFPRWPATYPSVRQLPKRSGGGVNHESIKKASKGLLLALKQGSVLGSRELCVQHSLENFSKAVTHVQTISPCPSCHLQVSAHINCFITDEGTSERQCSVRLLAH